MNVGSLFGDQATPLQWTDGGAKHAVHGFTECLRMGLAYHDDRIAVTLVHPGRIDTPYNEHAQSYLEINWPTTASSTPGRGGQTIV